MKLRKKPRKIVENKDHVDIVWKEKSTVEIFIPTLIDNYNHWMCGVDLSNQRIVYYHPNLPCIRNWIPIFIQMLSIVRNNSFIIHLDFLKKDAKSHKKFTLDMVTYLME